MTTSALESYPRVVVVKSFLSDHVKRYLNKRVRDVTILWEALERSDYAWIQSKGHKLKGTGTSYGFEAITDIGRNLEQAARALEREEVAAWITTLEQYIAAVEVNYE